MAILINVLILIILFIILSVAADFTVKNISYIAHALKIKLFAFGILLGLFTTLPEFSVGINTLADNAGALSVGNLIGGIIVIFGLILGVSLIINRQIKTDGKFSVLIPKIIVIFSPIIFGLDGKFSTLDGLGMIFLYLALIFYLYRTNYIFGLSVIKKINRDKMTSAIFLSLVGVFLVLISSHYIVGITLELLGKFNISKLIVGILVFAIGTNLPEITIAITSWRKKTSELSLSHLLSSGFTNTLALGILTVVHPITFNVNNTFYILAGFLALILILILFFYRSDKKMDRKEGSILLFIYLIFLFINLYLLYF